MHQVLKDKILLPKFNLKVGDYLSCEVETLKDGTQKICLSEPKKGSTISIENFLIIGINDQMQTYKILLGQEMVGWIISSFHVKYENIDAKFIGSKFYDISSYYIK